MTHRDLERAAGKAAAAREPLNKNGMHHDVSPPSTRAASEAQQTIAQPDPEAQVRDHSVAAGCAAVQYPGSVRSRLENPDRPSAGTQSTPETLYEQEVRLFGRDWADVYAARRARGENS